ncbi:MAG: uroporphyrinogen-III C-methyltransferase [Treponema sp.]|nr:uroporphyrinogen-III C-methyltransferase [Treponema sp.]
MTLRIGSRGSLLAMEQARIIENLLHDKCSGKHSAAIKTEIVVIQTSGDLFADKPVDSFGGKGVFTREIDTALLESRIDMAIHSLKDMPTTLPDGIVISAYCAAEDPRDVLVLPQGVTEIDLMKPAGSSAKRRTVQLSTLYPGISCAPIRGNVPTRLAKLDSGEYGAVLLAIAGLKRLGLESRVSRVFSVDEMMPAAGQGILAVVTRKDGEAAEIAAELDEPVLRRRAMAERAFTDTLGLGCGFPVAAFAVEEGGEMLLHGGYCPGFPDETDFIKCTLKGTTEEPEHLGQRLAFRMLAETGRRKNRLGSVALVGAGPGDSGLLTLRAEAVLGGAELVVFDRLVKAGVLAKIPRSAEKIYAGKECGLHELPQEEINAILVKYAAMGIRVVRLKGGDPMLFGRGSEEALCLSDAGIPYEIVPGVSSAIAVPAASGIPLTHRGIASSLHIIAAHHRSQEIDFSSLARQCSGGDTLVFMMGVSRIRQICGELVNAGLSGDTPAAVVSQGTTAMEKKVIATAATLSGRAEEAGIKAPALIVVGEVCRLEAAIAAYSKKPLAGLRIAVTRPLGGINRLAKMLDSHGAEVIELPTIKIVPLDAPALKEALIKPPEKTWLAFTSVHGVEAFFAKLTEYGIDIRSLTACKFAAVGSATCDALALRGITTDLVPETFSGAALGQALVNTAAKDETVILPRSAIGGRELPDALSAAGINCIDIPVYNTVPETGYENRVYRERLVEGLHYAAFTSPSAVEGFVKIFGNIRITALCIGEATAVPARELNMDVIVPQTASLEGMVQAILEHHSDCHSY